MRCCSASVSLLLALHIHLFTCLNFIPPLLLAIEMCCHLGFLFLVGLVVYPWGIKSELVQLVLRMQEWLSSGCTVLLSPGCHHNTLPGIPLAVISLQSPAKLVHSCMARSLCLAQKEQSYLCGVEKA